MILIESQFLERDSRSTAVLNFLVDETVVVRKRLTFVIAEMVEYEDGTSCIVFISAENNLGLRAESDEFADVVLQNLEL